MAFNVAFSVIVNIATNCKNIEDLQVTISHSSDLSVELEHEGQKDIFGKLRKFDCWLHYSYNEQYSYDVLNYVLFHAQNIETLNLHWNISWDQFFVDTLHRNPLTKLKELNLYGGYEISETTCRLLSNLQSIRKLSFPAQVNAVFCKTLQNYAIQNNYDIFIC